MPALPAHHRQRTSAAVRADSRGQDTATRSGLRTGLRPATAVRQIVLYLSEHEVDPVLQQANADVFSLHQVDEPVRLAAKLVEASDDQDAAIAEVEQDIGAAWPVGVGAEGTESPKNRAEDRVSVLWSTPGHSRSARQCWRLAGQGTAGRAVSCQKSSIPRSRQDPKILR